jgi:hypothetical protein
MLKKPIFTQEFQVRDFSPEPGSAYIFSNSDEERSKHLQNFISKSTGTQFVELKDFTTTAFKFQGEQISFRSKSQINKFWSQLGQGIIYIDITGLPHHIWAPLILTVQNLGRDVRVIYIEPSSYAFSSSPTEGKIFELSETIAGISPIPKFGQLRESADSEVVFIPLLGFEGSRLSYVLDQIQPLDENIIPIVGVPGFRIEFPFYTYIGNQFPLTETKSWQRSLFVPANCPFSLYYRLETERLRYPNRLFKIALIGTKPQALGAVLFYLNNTKSVELIYDHPIRKSNRTEGATKLLQYSISKLSKLVI